MECVCVCVSTEVSQVVHIPVFLCVRLTSLKARIQAARMTAPLFNTELYTHDLEDLYSVMWERYEKGLAPDHIQANSTS